MAQGKKSPPSNNVGGRQVKNIHIFLVLSVVFCGLFVSFVVRSAGDVFGFGGTYVAKNDGNCELLTRGEGPFSSEDFAEYKDGLFFVSAGDLGASFGNARHRDLIDGEMWVVDGNASPNDKIEKKIKLVPIEGLPSRSEIAFQPHGLYYSHKSNTLYAISHGGLKGGEKVFTFSVSQKSGQHGVDSVKLVFERAMSTPENVDLHFFFNDIIEGTQKGEFYMTQMLPLYPMPLSGHPETFDEHLKHLANHVALLTSKLTYVHRCTFDANKKSLDNKDVVCGVAASGFTMANGITTNPSRTKIWVADVRRVHELRRENDGTLSIIDTFVLPHLADNIEWTENGDLLVGTLPNAIEAIQKMGTGASNEGALHIIHQTNNKMSHSEDFIFHKGNQLGSVSAGALYKNKAFLGSPFHNGVLACEL